MEAAGDVDGAAVDVGDVLGVLLGVAVGVGETLGSSPPHAASETISSTANMPGNAQLAQRSHPPH